MTVHEFIECLYHLRCAYGHHSVIAAEAFIQRLRSGISDGPVAEILDSVTAKSLMPEGHAAKHEDAVVEMPATDLPNFVEFEQSLVLRKDLIPQPKIKQLWRSYRRQGPRQLTLFGSEAVMAMITSSHRELRGKLRSLPAIFKNAGLTASKKDRNKKRNIVEKVFNEAKAIPHGMAMLVSNGELYAKPKQAVFSEVSVRLGAYAVDLAVKAQSM